jgi:cell division septation protein DedD
MMFRILPKIICAAALFFVYAASLQAQEVSIVDQLKSIESGNIDEARSALRELKTDHPDDPSVIFLDAVLSAEGLSAMAKYNSIVDDYPNSAYADAAVYRIFSYYYSIGSYSKAESYLEKLKSDYPSSPYIKAADRSIPDETVGENEPVTVVPVQATIVPDADEFKYTVQAGAFLNIANAQNLSNKFKDDGYYSNIISKEAGGSILNIVLIGKFKSKEDAQSLVKKLEDDFSLKSRIIEYNF